MLLRSYSTPILDSLLPSSSSSTPHYSASPNHRHLQKNPPFLSSSSSFHGRNIQENTIIRRATSDGNLDIIPSFSLFKSKDNKKDDEEDGIGKGFSFMGWFQNLKLVKKNSVGSNGGGDGGGENCDLPLFLARGIGIDRIGSGLLNAGGCGDGSGGERSDVENYYRKMVEEDPSNALFLRNYAQFLYQSKGDTRRAEEYYSRAILAEPGDGEILSQYAKLVWELHNDTERASSYFQQAVRATPTDSHVLATYANFLWETEDDDDNGIGDGQLQGDFGTPFPAST